MSLIEKLGGYNMAKFEYDSLIKYRDFDHAELKDELLQYRREHNIFEIGDLVVLSKWANDFSKINDGIYEILSFENDLETLALLSQDIRSSTEHIKHATTEEIKAGRRL